MLVDYHLTAEYQTIKVTIQDLPKGFDFAQAGTTQMSLPDPIPLSADMQANSKGKESLEILDPADDRNKLKTTRKHLTPEEGALGQVQPVAFRVPFDVRLLATIDFAKDQGKIV